METEKNRDKCSFDVTCVDHFHVTCVDIRCEVRRNHGRSSTSIDASCTHGSTISNITCFEQAIFVLLLEA